MLYNEFDIEQYNWSVSVYLNVTSNDLDEVMEALFRLNCPAKSAKEIYDLINNNLNTGFTYTSFNLKKTVCCVGQTNSIREFLNTVFHEVYHIQNHISKYYDITKDPELPAYLTGTIAEHISTILLNIIKKFGI